MLIRKFSRLLRRYFIAGMVFIIPLWVTILIIKWIVNLVDNTFSLAPHVLRPRTYVSFFGIELVIALLLIILVGVIAGNYFGKKFLAIGERVLAKIPVIKTIYQGIKYLTTGIMGEKKVFSRVVLLEFPIKGLSFIGFVTGEAAHLLPQKGEKKMLKIFIPTTPNPTTGFFCIAAEDEVQPLDISVDDAFKLIISAGFADLKSR